MPFQSFSGKVVTVPLTLGASRRLQTPSGIAWRALAFPIDHVCTLSCVCVTGSFVDLNLQCPLKWKLRFQKDLKPSIWDDCPEWNLARVQCPHLQSAHTSSSYHHLSLPSQGGFQALCFSLKTCYWAFLKVFGF